MDGEPFFAVILVKMEVKTEVIAPSDKDERNLSEEVAQEALE